MRRGDWLHGPGVASAVYPAYTRAGTAELRVGSGLSARVTAAAHELGGGTHTVCQQVVARELGLDPARMRVDLGDGDMPPNGVAGGSRQSASMGLAVLDVCRRVRSELTAEATASGGPLEGADPASVRFEGGRITAGDREVEMAAVIEGVPFGLVEVRGSWTPEAAA